MTRILFGQSYYLRFDPKLWAAMQPYPPLGTLYAASFMRKQGYEVALFDAMLAESELEWQAAIARTSPQFAVIYEDNFNYLSKMCLLNMRQAAFTMTQMAKAAGATVIICGSDATDHAGQYLKQGADFVLLGEGEETLAELLNVLTGREQQPLEQILGLAYHIDGSGMPVTAIENSVISSLEFRHNQRRPDIKNPNELPFPAWDLVDINRYRQIWLDHHGYYSMNMVTTRGCPFHCNWCAKPIWGQRYNSRSPENVVAELKWLQEQYRPDHIWFADDIMGLKPGWWQQFADLVQAEGVETPFKCLSRADLLLRNGEDVVALKRAGCDIVWIGAESGSQRVLNAMEKGTTVAQIYEATARLHEVGVKVGFFLQFGYPGETRDEIELTLKMVRDCQPYDIGMSVSYPLPGTTFYSNVQAQLGVKQNWQDSADLAMMYQGPFATDFYRQLHIVLHKEFRNRRALIAWKEAVRRPRSLSMYHFRELFAAPYRMATLPAARRKLDKLAMTPHESIAPLPHMTLKEAARPTSQDA